MPKKKITSQLKVGTLVTIQIDDLSILGSIKGYLSTRTQILYRVTTLEHCRTSLGTMCPGMVLLCKRKELTPLPGTKAQIKALKGLLL